MQTKPSYSFSKFSSGEFEDLHQGLSKVFNIQKNDLHKCYQLMRESFESEGYPEYLLSKNIFRSSNSSFQQSYEDALVIGVDVPSVFELSSGILKKKTVFIIGQDPLRKSDKRVEEILVSTPYALHLKNCRELLPNTKLYFNLIEILLLEGYRVYLTDVVKIWVSQPDNSKHNICLSEIDRNRFIKALKAEIEIFKPLTIITWGKVAANTVEGLDFKADHFKFPHPSGAANGAWQNLMNQPATYENKIDFWKQKIIQHLENIR